MAPVAAGLANSDTRFHREKWPSSLTRGRPLCLSLCHLILMHKHAHELALPACVRGIAERHVQPRCLVHDALLVAKRIEALASMVLSHTARPHAAKAHMARGQMHNGVINTATTKGHVTHKALLNLTVLAKDIQGQRRRTIRNKRLGLV